MDDDSAVSEMVGSDDALGTRRSRVTPLVCINAASVAARRQRRAASPMLRAPLSQDRIHVRLTQPEHVLALAVLEDALSILAHGSSTPRGVRLFRETWDWIRSNDRSWPFSFSNLCDALDIDATRLRRHIATRVGFPQAPLASDASPLCACADGESGIVHTRWKHPA